MVVYFTALQRVVFKFYLPIGWRSAKLEEFNRQTHER